MNRYFLLSVLCLPCCSSLLAAQNDTLTVENARVRFVFATKPIPSLLQLVEKPSGVNLLADPAAQALFALTLRKADGGTTTVDGRSAKQGSIQVTPMTGGQRIALAFAGLGPDGNLKVDIEGHLADDEPIAQWSIAVDNPGSQTLAAVRFPYVAAVPAIGETGDDFIVAPALPGAIIRNPAAEWPAGFSLGWAFPGGQSAQFFSYQDHTAGLYLASMDTTDHGRALQIAKQGGDRFLLYQEYRLPEQVPALWKSPYDVALGATSGTWQQTADLYKRWAVQQPWCARTLAQRDDIPDFWKHGPCIHTVEVRTYNAERLCNGSYYPKLLEHLRTFRQRIDGPVVPMLAGWENHRRWTAGDYFPVFDESNAKRVIPELRRDGFSPLLFLSGLYYTFDNEGRDGSPVSGAERYRQSLVIDKATGKPKEALLNESSGQNTWKRHSYEFCPAAPETKAFFRSVVERLHALGVDIVQMDQTTSGAGAACYGTSHGHLPGPGTFQATAFHDLLRDMRQYGRSLDPQFLLFHEEVHEELIPLLDGFHTRESRERWWYRAAPGARGIPLFSYLYHEYAIAYGGEGPRATKEKSPAVVRQHAVNLVTGKTPAQSVWSYQQAVAETHPDQITMLRNHQHLLKTEAQRFLMLGRMLHPLEFDVATVSFPIAAQRQGKWVSEPFDEKAVLTSSWQSPEGLVGHCLVNITDQKQPLRLKLDTRNAPSWPKADVDLYRADHPETPEHLARQVALPYDYQMELAPLEALFFVLRPEKETGRTP